MKLKSPGWYDSFASRGLRVPRLLLAHYSAIPAARPESRAERQPERERDEEAKGTCQLSSREVSQKWQHNTCALSQW